MFSVNTNIASLQAQENLRISGDFQNKTISRVTSGLRIVNSGDDAAGLAIANGYRSDINVLTQGVRNANDGISLLQIVDGGMNNISLLLDRARTLATQSASGTFTGDRAVLNDEFKSVITEIDRQAQAIGLNPGGNFARSLSVFVGGGKGVSNTEIQMNGTVTVDLSGSTVDANSLGLTGVQAAGAADLSGKTPATAVTAILTDAANVASTVQPGYTDFYIAGPGFGGTGADTAMRVSVNVNGVSSASDLVNAINSAITLAGNGSTQQATAFKNANIRATLITDSATGKQTLGFSSSTAAFQVRGGDQMANALMGSISTGSTGNVDASSLTLTPNASTDISATTFDLTLGGAAAVTGIQVAGSTNMATLAGQINTALAGKSVTDVYAVAQGATQVQLFSRSGASFSLVAAASGAGTLMAAGTQASAVADDSWFSSAGDYMVGGASGSPLAWNNITAGQQTVTITATDAQGAMHSQAVTLDSTKGASIDKAIDTINSQLLQSSDTTLQNIAAVKDAHGGVQGIRFISTLSSFSVSLGVEAGGHLGIGGTGVGTLQGQVLTASQDGTAMTADIGTEQGAMDAVNALALAVSSLGRAQAVVGKGQNSFTYAVNLAQSQLSNIAAAESRIRDADLATEAANLTKAQTAIQAGVAALAQANAAPQAVLSLLRGQ